MKTPPRIAPILFALASPLVVSFVAGGVFSTPLDVGAVESSSARTADAERMAVLACSCPTSTSTETWTVSESWNNTCSLSGPSGSNCTATAVSGGYTLECAYPNGAPACASLKFTRPTGHEDLVGMEVIDPVCTSSPAYPNSGGTVTAKVQIPAHTSSPNRFTWDAWDQHTGGCSISIETKEEPPT